jgi:hypothetical protein
MLTTLALEVFAVTSNNRMLSLLLVAYLLASMKHISQKLLDSQDWSMFLESLPVQQRAILIALGRRALPINRIALECMANERSIGAQVSRLKKEGLISDTGEALYAICLSELRDEAEKQRIAGARPIHKADVMLFIEKEVYQTVIGVFEFLEHQQFIDGNGHYMAQKLAAIASQEVETCWALQEAAQNTQPNSQSV